MSTVGVSTAACTPPTTPATLAGGEGESASSPAFADKNARMYQMYFDSSGNPAANVVQVRRFIGHLHMADLAEIFGDVQALPQDADCNHVGGPVFDGGTTWFMTATPDLVGVNLVSIGPDGTRSSAFDLDGDRVIDIQDIFLPDQRRYTIFTELLGLDVIRNWAEGLDPFCNPELIRQLGLPDLGCNEAGGGSAGGGGFAPGSGIIDPIEMLCSGYDTGPMAGLLARDPNRAGDSFDHVSVQRIEYSTYTIVQVTTDVFDSQGGYMGTERVIMYSSSLGYEIIVEEFVNPEGEGTRTTTEYFADGTSHTETEGFRVHADDRGKANYDSNRTSPQVVLPAPIPDNDRPESDEQDSAESDELVPDDESPNEGNPGPDGGDLTIAEFCRERANHQSGIEQATSQNPAAINLSCDDLVGAPSSGNCSIITWAQPGDFLGVLEPPDSDDGCDEFNDPDGNCEGSSAEDRIRRFLGHGADLWSLDLPALEVCPPIVCNPAEGAQLQTYTAGGIDFSCPMVDQSTTLDPSEANCPPGTYYAPVTDRCIQIQIPEPGNDGSGACTLTTQACTNQGFSFDANKCQCVPIE